MSPQSAFVAIAIAAGLGFLVGLQRERDTDHFAGVRTFPLITVLGTLSALLAERFGGWILAAGLLGVVAASVIGNLYGNKRKGEGNGVTTEVATLVMFLVGALAWTGPREMAVVVGGGVAVLLHSKPALHGFVKRIGEKDARAIFLFALISLVILPVLPDKAYGPVPIDVLNPRQIWLMVVLVVGISFGGYIAYKILGTRAGAVLGGILGGMISSTATTVSYARRSVDAPKSTGAAALVIMLASTVVYGRVLVEIAIMAGDLLPKVAPPLLVLAGFSVTLAVAMYFVAQKEPNELPEQSNPTELKSALAFGAMFAVVLVAVAAGRHFFGERGVYAVAALSGLTDMDAITLSTARMANEGRAEPGTVWRAIVIASMANQVFKAGVVAVLGSRKLAVLCAGLFGAKIVAGGLVLWLWG